MSETSDGGRVRRGGCLCGAVRYEVVGEPTKIGLCHCADCRKLTGSAFLHYADWPRTAFRSSGPVTTYSGRSFCPVCGSRLFHLSDDDVEIDIGSLDEAPNALVPQVEGWTKRREPWLAPLTHAGQFIEDPL